MDLPYDSGAVRSSAPRLMSARRRWTLWIVSAVAAAIAIAVALQPVRATWRTIRIRSALTRVLEERMPEAPVRSRIAGARPPQSRKTRSLNSASSGSLALHAAVGKLFESASGIASADALHASGIGHYYLGKFAIAARDLERTAAETGRADHWNNLAAARFEAAIAGSAPHELPGALVAVDHALRIDPQLPAALYNRASIIETLGLRQHALRAWRLALVAEADRDWQDSIRERLRAIAPASDDEEWKTIVDRLELASEPDAGIGETTTHFAQQARLAAETELPNEWGVATSEGDVDKANRKLRLARALAAAVRRQSDESLAAESIAVIDAAIASRDAQSVAKLASAYLRYLNGRILYRRHDLARAEETLYQAARAFRAAGSPMAQVARYYAANAIADQNRVEEAAALNAQVLAEAREAGPRHRALAAAASWQSARYEGQLGHWDAALRAASDALADYRALGEKENAGAMESMLAELYDYLGQPNRAWEHRVAAFELLSEAGEAYRLQVALAAASRDRIRREDIPAAIALLDLEIELSRSDRGVDVTVDGLARRARAHAAKRDFVAARSDIVLGRAVVASVPDESLRMYLVAILNAAEGVIERVVDPQRSVRLLDEAIAFHQRASQEILLPELFLERGRSNLAAGRESAALSDFDSGIRSLEKQRSRLTDVELSSTIGDAGDELFAQAVSITARQGDVARAYDYSERSRARSLVARRLGDGLPVLAGAAPGVGVVEYMVLPDQVIAFTVSDQVRMTIIPIAHVELERLVLGLTTAIVAGAPIEEIREASGVLRDRLIRPLLPGVASNPTTVFVANKILQRVPWGVLFDRERGRYLIEDTIPLTAPSVALAFRGHAGNVRPSSALVAGNPRGSTTFVNLPPLPAAEGEARKIASYYTSSRLLLGPDASTDRFVKEAERHDVLHFAGHAVSSDISRDQAFLVLTPDHAADSGLLYSRDIAKLSLEDVRLVVLAACGTVRGSTVHLDGMPSIARSFLAAGAHTVLGTLWDIEDSHSADLFTRIHRAVANGTPVAEAVAETQLGALRSGNGEIAHPKTWAGLTLIGSW